MRFEIKRTSYYGESQSEGGSPPCEGAVPGMVPSWDMRTSESPKQHDAIMAERFGTSGPPPWLSEGTDHCVVESGGIARRRDDRETWVIEVDSLEALMEFVGEHGDVVVSRPFRSLPVIEIYDDYRE